MRRSIKSSFVMNKGWADSDEVNDLLVECTQKERKLFGKLMNSTDPVVYISAIADVTTLLSSDVSDAFVDLINLGLENVKASGSVNSSTGQKKYQCYYNETINVEKPDGRVVGYEGKKVLTECFDTEAEAERYCNTHVGSQRAGDSWIENEMNYDEIYV